MHRDWLITVFFLSIGVILFSASIDTSIAFMIADFVKRLISPITTGILP